MIKMEIEFTREEAIAVFENAGLEVAMANHEVWYDRPKEEDGGHHETIPILSVINPHTGQPHKIDLVFKRFIEMKKAELFLNPEKLEIYNLFTK